MKSTVGLMICVLLAVGCDDLKPGECKRDIHCDDVGQGEKKSIGVCYLEPEEEEKEEKEEEAIGTCMSPKEAQKALERYQIKKDGTCEDKDGDGLKAGDAVV